MSKPNSSLSAAIVSRARSWWQEQRRNADFDECATMSGADLDCLARDCGVTADQLLALTRRGPHAADEMHVLMQALNVDEAAMQRSHPGLLREMSVTCALCAAKAQCRHDLAQGDKRDDCPPYCGNIEAFDELRAARS